MKHDQASNLRKKISLSNNKNKAKTISVISGKGGVGKSNISINFSLQLIEEGYKVLLIDFDVGMGNVDILLGLNAHYTIVDMIENKLSIFHIVETGPEGLSYIAGGSGLNQLFTMNHHDLEYFYKEYELLIEEFDYIIFDMGAGLSENMMFLILASDECIVVTTPEPTSITDSYGMIKHIVNNDREMPIYVVMNRSSSQKSGIKALKRFQHVIANFLNTNINAIGVLPEDKIVKEAVIRQTPFTILSKRSRITNSIKQMTVNYLTNANQLELKPNSFIQKLKHLMGGR